jgi:hypothetical protein
MALLFGPNTRILFSGAIIRALAGTGASNNFPPYTVGVTVYAGVAPEPIDIVNSWATYNSSTPNYLGHFTNVTWGQTNQLLQMTVAPTPILAVNNGIATWAIIWGNQPTAPQLASTTLPLNRFLVVSASDAVGDGVIRFTSTTFVAGESKSLLDASMASNI